MSDVTVIENDYAVSVVGTDVVVTTIATPTTVTVVFGGSGGGSSDVESLGDLSDVTLSSPVSGNFLKYNGSMWVNSVPVASDISDFNESVDDRVADFIVGTANQVIVTENDPANTLTLSLPQSIATSSSPTFGTLTLSAVNSPSLTIDETGDQVRLLANVVAGLASIAAVDYSGAPTVISSLEMGNDTYLSGLNSVQLVTNNNTRWVINSSGHLIPQQDGVYDIGQVSSNFRPRTIYAHTSVVTPALTLNTFTGILKAASGVVSVATGGTDYENPLTFSTPLSRSVNTISIADATADGSTKGAAAFNATNFSASAGVINTIQGISSAASPTFVGLTLTGFTASAIPYINASKVLSQEQANFNYDEALNKLNVANLTVTGSGFLQNATIGTLNGVLKAASGVVTGSATTDNLTEGVTNLYFTNERVDDRSATLIQNGTGISWTYDDTNGTLTPAVSLASFSTTNLAEGSNLYYTDERVDDRAAALIQNGTNLTWTYVDGSNTLTGNVSAGGSTTQVQFNNSGVLGGSSSLTWSGSILAVGAQTRTNTFTVWSGSVDSNPMSYGGAPNGGLAISKGFKIVGGATVGTRPYIGLSTKGNSTDTELGWFGNTADDTIAFGVAGFVGFSLNGLAESFTFGSGTGVNTFNGRNTYTGSVTYGSVRRETMIIRRSNESGTTGTPDIILTQSFNAGTNYFRITWDADMVLTPAVRTTGSPTLFTLTGPAHTTLTASTEAIDVNWNLARTVQFAAGALTTQRAVVVQAPTYAFASASTITTAVTLDISGAPVAGTNATITNSYALRLGGHVALSDINLVLGTTTGTKIGTATTQKIGFWNATPLVQQTTASAAATFVTNTSLIANDTATFDGYTIGQVVKILRNLGILA